MKKAAFLALLLMTLVAPASASAHPLGNFTVNRYSGIEFSGDQLYVSYVLDMAEIPTVQERQKMEDEDVYAQRMATTIGRGLLVTVNGQRLALTPLRHALAFPPGVAGLQTMRLHVIYAAALIEDSDAPLTLSYEDTNFGERIGWKEVVLTASAGARVLSSSVPSESASRELRSYPKDLLSSPLDVTAAQATLVPGDGAATAPELLSGSDLDAPVSVRATSDGGFAKLIAADELSAGVVLVSLLVALFWGAAHAFSPGHGKAIVAGYLVGSRGTPRHAVYLGLIVTATHTIGVFALGLVTLSLSAFIVPEQLYPWLNLVSALLVVAVGLAILRTRLRAVRGHTEDHHHDHHHRHEHDRSLRGLFGIGVSAGLLPCPTALVVLLAAISLHRIGYGLVLILAFSAGLAVAVTSIGLLAVSAKRAFSRVNFDARTVRLLPAVSALVVLGFGLAMTVRALPAVA